MPYHVVPRTSNSLRGGSLHAQLWCCKRLVFVSWGSVTISEIQWFGWSLLICSRQLENSKFAKLFFCDWMQSNSWCLPQFPVVCERLPSPEYHVRSTCQGTERGGGRRWKMWCSINPEVTGSTLLDEDSLCRQTHMLLGRTGEGCCVEIWNGCRPTLPMWPTSGYLFPIQVQVQKVVSDFFLIFFLEATKRTLAVSEKESTYNGTGRQKRKTSNLVILTV